MKMQAIHLLAKYVQYPDGVIFEMILAFAAGFERKNQTDIAREIATVDRRGNRLVMERDPGGG